MNKKNRNDSKQTSNIWLLSLLFLIIIIFITVDFVKFKKKMDYIYNHSGNNNTGTSMETGDIVNNNVAQSKTLIENQEGYDDLSIYNFPKIKINKPISDIHLIAEITFTKDFVQKYKYANSTGYFFALKFFIGDLENGGYYNVYRNQNGGVGNSQKHGLTGAKLAYIIKNGAQWDIPLNNKIPIAVKQKDWSPTYQYKYLNIEDFLNNNIGKELPIGVYLSSAGLVDGYKLTRIISLEIKYTGEEGAIDVISN